MAINGEDFSALDTMVWQRVDGNSSDQWWWTPTPIHLSNPPVTNPSVSGSGALGGSYRFPRSLVDAHAALLVDEARHDGQRHRLSLWRTALRDTLEQLMRDRTGAGAGLRCVSLGWDLSDGEYLVTALFTRGAPTRQ